MQKKIKIDRLIYFIEIIQILVLILFLFLYKGIFMIGGFIALSLGIIIFTYRQFRHKDAKWFKIQVTILLFLSIIIFIMMFLSKPKYTFNDGMDLVYNQFSLEETYEYKAFEIKNNTLPSTYEEIHVFHSNRVYYYRFVMDDEYRYFIVLPASGVVMETDEIK